MWEYMIITASVFGSVEEINYIPVKGKLVLETLDEFGKNGWECFSVTTYPEMGTGFVRVQYTLKHST